MVGERIPVATTIRIVIVPPNTTSGTVPISRAVAPLSKAPIFYGQAAHGGPEDRPHHPSAATPRGRVRIVLTRDQLAEKGEVDQNHYRRDWKLLVHAWPGDEKEAGTDRQEPEHALHQEVPLLQAVHLVAGYQSE